MLPIKNYEKKYSQTSIVSDLSEVIHQLNCLNPHGTDYQFTKVNALNSLVRNNPIFTRPQICMVKFPYFSPSS